MVLMATISWWSWPINWRWSWLLISRWMSHDRATIGPRSHVDRGSWSFSLQLSDEDRAAAHDCAFDENQTLPVRPRVGMWVFWSSSLKLDLAHVSWSQSRGLGSTRSTPRNRLWNPRCHHVSCTEETSGSIVPHGERKAKPSLYKVGQFKAIVLPPLYSNQGPLTHRPFTRQPPHHMAPLTGVRVDLRGLLPRVRTTCASRGPCAALPRGLSATSHPRWSHAPHQLRAPR